MAKKNHKRQYHRAPPPKVNMPKPVRLSQCMIVKNEEKNIEKALSWAKGIAIEQIVVDTGSTDRTVEIAESMGAKVYHFEWINDFSAAKNYAIDQAKGDWIAFLDADEYFTDEDAKKLVGILKNINNDPNFSKLKTAISCPWVQLDDNGQPFQIHSQMRIFKNTPEIRYEGSIHETLTNLGAEAFKAPELSIMHTGYSMTSFAETGKSERNIEMIKVELEKDPENADMKCYYADALYALGDPENNAAVEFLYREALASGQHVMKALKMNAYNYLCATYLDDVEKHEENLAMCRRAYEEFPDSPDFCYYYGRRLYIGGDIKTAFEKFSECESILKQDSIDSRAEFIIKNPMTLFILMVLAADKLGKPAEVIRCATLVLKDDKYQQSVLAPYISAFNQPGYETPADEIFSLLGKIYDFNNTKDKLTVLQAVKNVGSAEIVQMVLTTFSKDELDWLTGGQG